MKKDRNCGVPYPIYPPYQGMPMMGNMMGMPTPYSAQNFQTPQSNYDQQLNNLNDRINNLDKRITILEEMFNQNNSVNYSNNTYNSNNYPMM